MMERVALRSFCLTAATLLAFSPSLHAQMGADYDTAVEANTAFDRAIASRDRATLDQLLDPEFAWIFTDGTYYRRSDVLRALPEPATAGTGMTVTVDEREYGRVRALEVASGLVRALRVWVGEPGGWRLVHINELITAPPRNEPRPYRASYRDTVITPPCINPCETVPYTPTTPRARDALLSWQQQEIGAHMMDMDLWGAYVTDEWVGQRTGAPPLTKDERIARTLVRVEHGVQRSAQATVLQMRLHDLEDAVLMISLTQGFRSQPQYRSRIFVHEGQRADGGDRYRMAESYGQPVVGTPVFERQRD